MSAEGMILRARMTDIREIGRNAQGVRVMDLPEEDRLVGVAKLAETEEEDISEVLGEKNPEGHDSRGRYEGLGEILVLTFLPSSK